MKSNHELGRERVLRIRDILMAQGYRVHVEWDGGKKRPEGYSRDLFGGFDIIAVSENEVRFIQACGDEGYHMAKIRRNGPWPTPLGLSWEVWREQRNGIWVFVLRDGSFHHIGTLGVGEGQGVQQNPASPVGRSREPAPNAAPPWAGSSKVDRDGASPQKP